MILRGLFVLLLLCVAQADDGLKEFSEVLRFGTEGQQAEALNRIRGSGFPKGNAGRWEESLSAVESMLDLNATARAFMGLVMEQKIERYFGDFELILTRRDAKGEDLTQEDLATMGEAMSRIAAWSNQKLTPLVADYATNALKNRRHPALWAESLKAVESLKPAGLSEFLRRTAEDDGTPEPVAAAAVRAVAAYRNPEDIAWIAAYARDEGHRPLGRWQAAAALGGYAPDSKARAEALRIWQGTDLELRLRALYSLGSFGGAEFQDILMKATRDNSQKIRQAAIAGLAKLTDAESAEVLKWKYHNDPEPVVKAEAAKAMTARGLPLTNVAPAKP